MMVKSSTPALQTARAVEAAAILFTFSVFVLVEGITRVNLNTKPAVSFRGTHTVFPPIVALVSAVGEVIFGMAGAPAACQYNEFALKFSQVNIASTGLVVGFYALAHRYTTPLILKITMGLELVFGWFVFTTYVLAMPSFAAARLEEAMPMLNLRQSRAVIMMGLVGSIAVCGAEQGGQFMATNILHIFVSGKGSAQTGGLYRTRLYFFASLVILKGVPEIVIGSILRSAFGSGMLPMPNVQPPYAVTRADLNIADGVLVTLVGVMGLAIAAANLKSLRHVFSGLCFLCLLVQFGLYDMGSVGVGGPMVIPVGSLQVVLTAALMIMPAYCAAHMADGDDEGAVDQLPSSKHEAGNGHIAA